MMMVFKRKEVLVSALILLIGAAAVVNYNYNKNEANLKSELTSPETYSVSAVEEGEERKVMMGEATEVSADAKGEVDYFSQAKLNRESARSKKLEILNSLLENPDADLESKKKAEQDLLLAASLSDKEAICESLIISKGFSDAVVFISDENVSVTVKADNFDAAKAKIIQEIIVTNTQIETKYIKIVAV